MMRPLRIVLYLLIAVPLGCQKPVEEDGARTLRRAEDRILAGDFEGARKYLMEVLQKEPDNGRVHLYLGNIHFSQYKYDQAREEYLEAARLWPENHIAHYQLAQLYYIKGNTEGALREIDRTLELKPDYQSALCLKGFFYLKLKQPEAARDVLQKCLSIPPESTLAHTLLGDAHQEMEELDLAIVEYERARKINPYMLDSYRGAIEVYGKLGKFEEVKRLSEIYLNLKTSQPPEEFRRP